MHHALKHWARRIAPIAVAAAMLTNLTGQAQLATTKTGATMVGKVGTTLVGMPPHISNTTGTAVRTMTGIRPSFWFTQRSALGSAVWLALRPT